MTETVAISSDSRPPAEVLPLDAGLARMTKVATRAVSSVKADDLVIYDVRGRTSYCDLIVVATAHSARQVRAIANRVLRELADEKVGRPLGVEGLEACRWVLVDMGDVLVNVFDRAARGHYDLDGLWADARRIPFSELGLNAHGLEGAATPETPEGLLEESWDDDDELDLDADTSDPDLEGLEEGLEGGGEADAAVGDDGEGEDWEEEGEE